MGGYAALLARYSTALPNATESLDPQRYNISARCYTPRPDAFQLLRDPVEGDLPWPGVLFGIAIVGGWYWCTDQVGPHQIKGCRHKEMQSRWMAHRWLVDGSEDVHSEIWNLLEHFSSQEKNNVFL